MIDEGIYKGSVSLNASAVVFSERGYSSIFSKSLKPIESYRIFSFFFCDMISSIEKLEMETALNPLPSADLSTLGKAIE